MATRIARCTNFGRCSIADWKHSVQIPQGSDLICPECRQLLLAVAVASQCNNFVLRMALSAVLFTLRLHGSDTIGESLGPGLAAAFFRQDGASDILVRKRAQTNPSSLRCIPAGANLKWAEIAAHGSANAFADLGKGMGDLGMASCKIKPEEAVSLAKLLGFSDGTGSPAKNIALPKERASTVAKLFEERGVKPGSVAGIGLEMPVALNDTEDGLQKNRRVKIWIKKS